jgi:hypothetical protein
MRARLDPGDVAVTRAVLSALVVAALAAPAAASPRVMVDVDGDDTGIVRKAVKRALADRPDSRPLIVYGTIEKTKKKGKKKVAIRLTITLNDGTVLGELRVDAATKVAAAARVAKRLPGAIAIARAEPKPAAKPAAKPVTKKLVAKAAAKPKPAPKPAPAEPEEDADGEEDSSESGSGSSSSSAVSTGDGVAMSMGDPEPADGGQTWLSIGAGPELVARHFSYRDDVFQELRQYDLAGAAAFGITADAYPLRNRRDWLAGLGGAARFWYARPFDSDAVNGETYTSKSNGWSVGARWRRTVAGVEVAGALDLGRQSFNVDAAGSEYESMVPAVRYTYVRPGVSGRIRFLDRYAAELALGYRHVLSAGEISTEPYFPRLGARGVDLEGQVSYALPFVSGLDVRAGAGLERYGFDLQPEPGDERVAGGATDSYPRLFLRVGYTR